MKLPWKLNDELKERLEQKEEKIEELKEEKQSWKERFEAEKDRRSELSRKKQEAEQERNRLKEKLKDRGQEVEESAEDDESEFRSLEFNDARKLLEKLDSMQSPERELVTVYCPGEVDNLSDLKSLKNSVSASTNTTRFSPTAPARACSVSRRRSRNRHSRTARRRRYGPNTAG